MEPDKEKIIDKVAKLKAHAESAAKIGNEAEALAFAEAFQRLLLKHDLSLTDIEVTERDKEEPVGEFEVDMLKHGLEPEGRREGWFDMLAGIIARGHFCRIILHNGSKRFSIVGRRSHVALAEYMIVTLTRAAETLADKERTKYAWERYKETRDRDGKGTANVKGFKAAFLQAFTFRLHERYDEILKGAKAGSSVAMVRFNDAAAAVEDFMKNRAGLRSGRRKLVKHTHAQGWQRGRAAADAIDLNGKAVGVGSAARVAGRLR